MFLSLTRDTNCLDARLNDLNISSLDEARTCLLQLGWKHYPSRINNFTSCISDCLRESWYLDWTARMSSDGRCACHLSPSPPAINSRRAIN
ncbi:hypothetical protein J6590_037387 [Homalodisca vitripennis]|nr:hypothetical protein J6590_037387 [Homalodisca vitripennis]